LKSPKFLFTLSRPRRNLFQFGRASDIFKFMANELKKLVLIDSNAIIHRAYHALPKTMSTRKGELTNVVYGYTTTLIKVLEDISPDYIAASFDLAGKTFRHEEYTEYKAHRVKADQELYDQIPRVRQLLETLNIPVYEMAGFEADDCIGTISNMFEERGESQKFKGFEVFIVTGDKDAFQLVDGNIFVYDLKKGLSVAQIINRKVIDLEWGLHPEDFVDLKALAGDPSDNIPGVPGIGNKTATTLLHNFGSLVKLYEKIAELCHPEQSEESSAIQDDKTIETVAKEMNIKPRILKLLLDNKEQAFLSQRLATIRRDVPLDFKLEDCKWGDYDKEKVQDFFEEMQFHSLLRRFGAERSVEPKPEEVRAKKAKDEQLTLL
jgi:DNA polymerase-1